MVGRQKILIFSQLINRFDFMDVLIRYADPKRFDMIACTFTKNSNIERPEFERHNFRHIDLGLPFNKRGFIAAVFRLARLVRTEEIKIIHAHHYYESFIAYLALLFVPSCKLIITRHYHNELYLTTASVKLRIYLFLEKLVNNKSRFIISPSSQISDLLRMQKVRSEKVRQIPYGFDFSASKYSIASMVDICKFRSSVGVEKDHVLIGNFGRHHPIKGQDDLLVSFAEIVGKHKNIRLLMVGDGPSHEALIELTTELGINNYVIFIGWQKDINIALSSVDLVWHPTRQEAFPQIMIETMALGKPIFITPVSGATDVIQNKKNGFIIPFNDPKAWCQQILDAVESRDLLATVAIEARKVTSGFDINNIIEEVEKVYSDVR